MAQTNNNRTAHYDKANVIGSKRKGGAKKTTSGKKTKKNGGKC